MKYFDKDDIEKSLNYPLLIEKLKKAFQEPYQVPPRLHFDYSGMKAREDSTLLLMPAWKNREYVGLKVLTISPSNTELNKPTIQGVYILMSAIDGAIIAQFDAMALTNMRTAAASALASKFLSLENSRSLLMVGTGALAPEMIKAHCAVRPIKDVYVWGRNHEKAQQLAQGLAMKGINISAVKELNAYLAEVDVISTATSSPEPLIFGEQILPGQHLDLVGAFKPTWREADDEAIINSFVFVDTREGTLKESGELLIPIGKGLLSPDHIQADLFELCKGKHMGRKSHDQKTVFISVGYALEDLAAAELVWSIYRNARK